MESTTIIVVLVLFLYVRYARCSAFDDKDVDLFCFLPCEKKPYHRGMHKATDPDTGAVVYWYDEADKEAS